MAVDKVPYGRLTQNIKMHNIYGDLVVQFLNWFTQKTEGRRLERCYSDQMFVASGIPQGSMRGTPLFMIYINDLDKNCRWVG